MHPVGLVNRVALGNCESCAMCLPLARALARCARSLARSVRFLPKPVVPGERAKRVRVLLVIRWAWGLFPLLSQCSVFSRLPSVARSVWRSHGAEYTTKERTNYGVQTDSSLRLKKEEQCCVVLLVDRRLRRRRGCPQCSLARSLPNGRLKIDIGRRRKERFVGNHPCFEFDLLNHQSRDLP